MIRFHGIPVTPDDALVAALTGRHAMVSFMAARQLSTVSEICSSFALDNGAFSAWRRGQSPDWRAYYSFVETWRRHPGFAFAVIPDVIDGSEDDNDALLQTWPFSKYDGAPVWHLHERVERLKRLCAEWPRVALGSSGEFAEIGTLRWWRRMGLALSSVCDEQGRPPARLHGLRMLSPKVVSVIPLASADSTNIARNIGLDVRWRGPYEPPTKASRAALIRDRMESGPTACFWDWRNAPDETLPLFPETVHAIDETAALAEKLRINQSRRWPAPGSVPEGEAVEHEEGA